MLRTISEDTLDTVIFGHDNDGWHTRLENRPHLRGSGGTKNEALLDLMRHAYDAGLSGDKEDYSFDDRSRG